MKKISLVLILIIVMTSTGCMRDADKVSFNISKDADNFRVKRRIVFINLRTDNYLFEITGNCSLGNSASDELEVTCKIGEDKFQKHFLYLGNGKEITYTVEQLEYSDVDQYKYEIRFKPESIIPIKLEVE